MCVDYGINGDLIRIYIYSVTYRSVILVNSDLYTLNVPMKNASVRNSIEKKFLLTCQRALMRFTVNQKMSIENLGEI